MIYDTFWAGVQSDGSGGVGIIIYSSTGSLGDGAQERMISK